MIIYFNFILFLLFSSFVKCIVDSNINKQFFYRRSKCDVCKEKLNFFDLIPVFSYLFLAGKCRYCKNKISLEVFLYEIFAFIVAVVYLATINKVLFLNILDYFVVLILIFIAIEDIKTFEINSKLQLILSFFVIIKLIFYFDVEYIASFLILTIVLHILYFLLQKSIGYGDIKLLSILFLTTNVFSGLYLFIYTFIYAGFFAIYLLITKKVNKKSKIALAPYICLAYITILVNRELLFIW